MTHTYIVTEGQFDAVLLEKLIPKNMNRETTFVVRSGGSSALSLARTILAVKRVPVALVVDADTTSESAICERQDLLRSLLNQAAVRVRFEVFLAVPEIETVFFVDRPLLEHLVHQKISDIEWSIAEFQPKKVLTDILHRNSPLAPLGVAELPD